MTTLDRLKLELANREYLSGEQFSVILDENGLEADSEYSASNRKQLLEAVLAVFEILANDLDLFRKVETEFATTSEAFSALTTRIQTVKNKISAIDAESGVVDGSVFSAMYFGG